MSSPLSALLSHYENEARAALVVEEELRREFTRVVTEQERARAYAFRRAHFLRVLAGAALGPTDESEAIEAQMRAARAELGWEGESEAHDSVLEHLTPVATALWMVARDGEDNLPAAQSALAAFEAWFAGCHGKSFYAIFDQYVREVPVVDF